ncbi:MAG: hypothetical protein EBV06_03110 [Planctomycetia bacterium]|nr:hypothetical protein [Planctomycetia bacterium]
MSENTMYTETFDQKQLPSLGRTHPLGLVPLALFMTAALLVAVTINQPQPICFAGLIMDRLTAALALLVGGVGLACYRFSLRHLDGDPGQPRFLRLLNLTVASAFLLMLASNIILLFAAWTLTSYGLHGLLTYCTDRPERLRPARKKFLISRLGDLMLLAAFGLIFIEWNTLDAHDFLGANPTGPMATTVALLLAGAALTKSAQVPFHSWLPETLESPTPVSAMMHAGIINAGGALVLRFAPLMAQVPAALLLLSLVGTLTAVLGAVAMWSQVKVKRTLAWSTVSQMGFTMIQCGVAAFSAAALHMIGHGFYKAFRFLRAGDTPLASSKPIPPVRTLTLTLLGSALSIPVLMYGSRITGFEPLAHPGEMALSVIVLLSVGQTWVGLVGNVFSAGRLSIAFLLTLVVPLAACGLYHAADTYFAPVWGERAIATGPVAWIAAVVPVLGFVGLTVLNATLPILGRVAGGRALYVYALNGFYFGAMADRVVDAVWPMGSDANKEIARA